MSSAIIAGASGLIGNQLLQNLISDTTYSSIHILVRKRLPLTSPKITQHIVDFNQLNAVVIDTPIDVAFCTLGTTQKKAGSKMAFKQVDMTFVIAFATLCHSLNIPQFQVISSIGAKATSNNFYLKTKGEMEENLQKIGFEQLILFRPSLLIGSRKEFRLGEKLAILISPFINVLLWGKFKKFRSINYQTVAHVMQKMASQTIKECSVIESDQIKEIRNTP